MLKNVFEKLGYGTITAEDVSILVSPPFTVAISFEQYSCVCACVGVPVTAQPLCNGVHGGGDVRFHV
jgi:hypothetical protein